MKRNISFALLPVALLLSACSEAPKESAKKEKPPEAAPEPITGQTAFFRMYTAARGWAPDAEGYVLRSLPMPEVKSAPGQAGAWEAVFVSAKQSRSRRYTWSAVEAEGNLHKGVFALNEEGWSGPRGVSRPFNFQGLKIDTTAAYATAIKKGKGAAEFLKKNPSMNVSFLLEQTKRFPDLTWRVIWGESVSTSSYSVFVDASTGEYLETVR